MYLKGLAIFLLVYAVVLYFTGFAKVRWMIQMAKAKLGKDATEQKAIRFMYISATGLLVAGVLVSFFAFG